MSLILLGNSTAVSSIVLRRPSPRLYEYCCYAHVCECLYVVPYGQQGRILCDTLMWLGSIIYRPRRTRIDSCARNAIPMVWSTKASPSCFSLLRNSVTSSKFGIRHRNSEIVYQVVSLVYQKMCRCCAPLYRGSCALFSGLLMIIRLTWCS